MDEVIQKPSTGKFKAKWVWLIVIGSLLFVLLMAGFVFAIIFTVRSAIMNGDAYNTAIAYIEDSEEIREVVGEITGYGFIPTGSVSTGPAGGNADFTITVRGTRGNARVAIALVRPPGELDWTVTRMSFRAS